MLGKNAKEREVAGTNAPIGRGGSSNISVIGKGMGITGDCATDGQLRVEGKVTGNVRAQGLEVTASGGVEGDVAAPAEGKGDQLFVIGGRVTGTVRAKRVEVRGSGAVLGGVIADEVTIEGRVEGGITARARLALAETAVVDGEVRAQRLSMKEGGQVNGTIHMGDHAMIDSKGPKAEKVAASSSARGEQRDDARLTVGAGAA